MNESSDARRQRLAQAALEASQVLLFWIHPGGDIVFANEAAARELRTSSAALEGARVAVLGNRFERDLFATLAHLKPGQKVRFESEGLRPDGTPVSLGMSVMMAEHEGEPMLVLIGADLSSQRETQEKLRDTQEMLFQAQKMEAIGGLAAGVAHDFNNLLAVIVGSVELLDAGALSPAEAAELRNEIREAAGRGARLTRQLLAFSQQQIVAPSIQAPSLLVPELEKLLRRILGENFALRFEVSDPEALIRIDSAQLEQVLINLAMNARDAMPNGGELAVRVRVRKVDGPVDNSREVVPLGDYVEIAVADTGTGMTPEIESRAFEPFFSTKERGKGTGLGLATVYGIVRQAGGYVALQTEAGRGTSIQLLFPRVEEGPEEPLVSPTLLQRPGAGERILFVEDDRELRRLTARVLSELGFDVLAARDAREALEIAVSVPSIDLLLTDVVLPGLNGLVLAKRLAADRPSLRVLFVSGYAEDAEVLREIVDGSRLLLPKPFSRAALSRFLAAALAGAPFASPGQLSGAG